MARTLDTNRYSTTTDKLVKAFGKRIVGQEEAVRTVVDAVERYRAGMCDPTRPAANLLFLGPTGTGKTSVAETLAEGLFGNPRACIKIDCAEYQHSHEIAKLVGSPPGYLGHRETHPLLTQKRLAEFHTDELKLSILLFDEIEKASDALWNLLLGIMDKAALTTGTNEPVNFVATIIIMTSNIGAAQMAALAEGGMGFLNPNPDAEQINAKLDNMAVQAAKRKFSPEFFNRIDSVAVFKTLTEEQIKNILQIELGKLQTRLLTNANTHVFLHTLKSAKERLLKEGYDKKYGARFLKRAIVRMIENPLAKLIASGQVKYNDVVLIKDVGATAFEFSVEDNAL